MIDHTELSANIHDVRARLEKASENWPHQAELCAVTKTIDTSLINLSYDEGIRVIGENRVQELIQKIPALNPDFKLHIIGQLQTNKVKYIVDVVDMVQSLDRIELAWELDRRSQQIGLHMPVLVQVNIAQEPQKAGVYEKDLVDFITSCSRLPGIRVEGLMAIMPFVDDPELIRPYFKQMRVWFERIRSLGITGVHMKHLSMGMSGDFEVAAQEGATMVRVGSSIFGRRQ